MTDHIYTLSDLLDTDFGQSAVDADTALGLLTTAFTKFLGAKGPMAILMGMLVKINGLLHTLNKQYGDEVVGMRSGTITTALSDGKGGFRIGGIPYKDPITRGEEAGQLQKFFTDNLGIAGYFPGALAGATYRHLGGVTDTVRRDVFGHDTMRYLQKDYDFTPRAPTNSGAYLSSTNAPRAAVDLDIADSVYRGMLRLYDERAGSGIGID